MMDRFLFAIAPPCLAGLQALFRAKEKSIFNVI